MSDNTLVDNNSFIPGFGYSTILEKDITKLLNMDINEVKSCLVKEFEALDKLSFDNRQLQLNKIMMKLFNIQPRYDHSLFHHHEFKLYFDLISIPEIYNNKNLRDFLESDSLDFAISVKYKKDLLLKIYNFYDNHTEEEIEKFNYVLSSSNDLSYRLLYMMIDFDLFFCDRVFKMFDKEDMSQLYRFVGKDEKSKDLFDSLLSEENKKVFFMISIMSKKIKSVIGHDEEFLKIVLDMFEFNSCDNNFIKLLNSYYDQLVVDEVLEEDFEKNFLHGDSIIEMRELISYIVNPYYGYDENGSNGLKSYDIDFQLDKFMNWCKLKRLSYHHGVFKSDFILKIEDDSFSFDSDFVVIDSDDKLDFFKKSVFNNIYGISDADVYYILKVYGKYIDEFDRCVRGSDRNILEVLKTIKNISELDLSDSNFNYKLSLIQQSYYSYIKENGIDYQNSLATPIVIQGLLNKMVINTYNNRLLNLYGKTIIDIDDGVKVIDPGFDFDIILTSLYGVEKFYESNLNMASKWNTAFKSKFQGLSVSHISNENLGVISLKEPLLGFNYIPEESLNAMGPRDIFSYLEDYALRSVHMYRSESLYVPASIMSDVTRYGYNELLLDRFLKKDENNQLKLQPDYVVFYKFNNENYDKKMYSKCKKLAKDFDIPIVLVDVEKIKNHEKEVIEKLEEELFTSDTFNPELLSEIVTRYMNNYTGSLTMVGSVKGYEDFSISGMEKFFSRLFDHIESIKDKDVKEQWINTLVEVHDKENEKVSYALNTNSFAHSVGGFILFNMGISDSIEILKCDKQCDSFDKDRKDILIIDKINSDLFNCLLQDMIFVDEDIVEYLVSSYFVENNYESFYNMELKKGEQEKLINSDSFIEHIVNIKNIDDDIFVRIFRSYIKERNSITNENHGDIVSELLDKKNNIDTYFSKKSKKL